MKVTMTSVALVAMLGTISAVTTAEASQISLESSGTLSSGSTNYGDYSESFVFDTDTGLAQVMFSSRPVSYNGTLAASVTAFAFHNLLVGVDFQALDLSSANPVLIDEGFSTYRDPQHIGDPITTLSDFTTAYGDARINGTAFSLTPTTYSLNGSIPVSVVPLPATASLFGAALLAIGGLGYARRRALLATAR